jgi:RNA polymerase sigma-70 factor (ECF subfamily)
LPTPKDEELVVSVRQGDMNSLAVLVSRWQEPLFRFAYRLLERREEARDVCQETFLRVLKRADRFEPGARFSTWLYQIALNLCRDRLRRRKRWSEVLVEGAEPSSFEAIPSDERLPSPSTALERERLHQVVRQALASLPPEQREVLVLKEYEGLTFREIAELTGRPESTIKSRLYQGLDNLRTELERRGVRPFVRDRAGKEKEEYRS